MLEEGVLNLHPGGHGALWHMAKEKGIFERLLKQKKTTLLIRQINNPIAGEDDGLISFVGVGKKHEKIFGFASCERVVNAAEGILVQIKKENSIGISNIEYTDFEKIGFVDKPLTKGISEYPANTNLLFVDLPKILPYLSSNPLPSLILNMKTLVPTFCVAGEKKEVKGGRLESMMQSIADSISDPPHKPLSTFVTYNERRKTISTTKRTFVPGKSLLETPEGAFYDLQLNHYELLKKCGFKLPVFSTEEDYLARGPSPLFIYHPALGPFYSIIAQKLKGGELTEALSCKWKLQRLK